MKKHRNIALVGMMGSGKTAVGRALSRALGWYHRDLDDVIVEEGGCSIPEIFAREGESGFREREARCLARIVACSHTVLSTGGGAVLAAANRDLLRAWGLVVWLDADPATLERRLRSEAEQRPLLSGSESVPGKLAELARERETAYRACAHHVIDTASLAVDDVVARILERGTLDRAEDAP